VRPSLESAAGYSRSLWAITDNPKLPAAARDLIMSPKTIAVEELPLHHQDPFDRILVAQALVEPMRLMTHDPLVALYNDTIIKI